MEKKKIIIISGIIVTLIILMGSAFAFFTYSKSREAFTLTSNNITATFVGVSNQINFTNAYPISDEYAISNIDKLTYIDFTVSGDAINENESVGYEIFLTEKDGNTLSNNYVKLYLTDDDDNEIVSPTLYSSLATTTYNKESSGKVIYKTKTKGETRKYRLYAWIDQDYSDNTISRTFSFYVNLYAYNDTREGIYKVTFDYNDGVTKSTTKYVTYHDTYGELPTPERDGYTFMGWNGKNYSQNINEENYLAYNFSGRTSIQFINDDISYVRINGYQSESLIDTSWRIYTRNKDYFFAQSGNYVLSFDIRSLNAKPTQYIKQKQGSQDGKTGIYKTNLDIVNLVGNIAGDINFTNDGDWHRVSSLIILEEDISDGIIVIGNDIPNIYGINGYIDIANIQLEEGDTATEFEPYYITSSTKVVQNKDHTLKAIWKEN